MGVDTDVGAASAALLAIKRVSGRLGGSTVRELWVLSLRVGGLEIANGRRWLSPGRMNEEFLRGWARRQTAEGYQANVELCDRLLEELRTHD